MKKLLSTILTLGVLLGGAPAQAANRFAPPKPAGHRPLPPAEEVRGGVKDTCQALLMATVPDTYIVPSGNDGEHLPTYHEMIKDIFGKGGVAELLGIAVPKHQVEFVSNTEIAILGAAHGRHPVPSWVDGAQIANSRGTSTLEFVWGGVPGCSACRAYYVNTLKPSKNLFILLHVAGHNDVSEHSMFWDIRSTDMMAASLRLDDLMRQFHREYDPEEVSQWYQYLMSLQHAQDYARSTYDQPAQLGPDQVNPETGRNPLYPTPSLLQAVVANLDPSTPLWKRQMAELFEEVNRSYSYVSAQKGLNEGWATFLMWLLAQYLPEKYQTDHFALEYAELLSSVKAGAGASITNPYWLGTEAWFNLRRRFHARPDIAKLPTMLEKDQKFVKYAHGLIEQQPDYDFYRTALDEQWVKEKGFYLYRRAEKHEQTNAKPPKEGLEQKIITSTGKRVVNHIARMTSDRTLTSPRIHADNPSAFGRNVFSMVHEVYDEIPLQPVNSALTMFVMSRILKRPVSLRTIGNTLWFKQNEPPQSFPIRMEVDGNGRIQIFSDHNGKEEPIPGLVAPLQQQIDNFKQEIDFGLSPGLAERMERDFMPAIVTQVVNGAVSPAMAMLSHTPTAARAVMEYAGMIERRTAAVLKRLLDGKAPLDIKGNAVRVKVLPSIPTFALDQATRQKIIASRGLAPVDDSSVGTFALQSKTDPAVDDGSSVGKGSVKPGDRVWGPGGGGGQGKGDPGDEEGDPEDGDDPAEGDKPGKPKKKDPSEVDIDLGTIGEFLASEFELPNMKRTGGLDTVMDLTREGGMKRPSGNVLWERMIPQVLALGRDAVKRQGKDPRRTNSRIIMREGFKLIQPSDYVVSASEPTPMPDKRAVLIRVADLTGSMHGKPQELEMKFFKLLEAMLRSQYKEVEIRSIGYDDTAEEYPGDKIFKIFKGGGNTDSTGYELAEKILHEYPAQDWNAYVVGAGDGGSTDTAKTVASMRRLYERTQYMGFVHIAHTAMGIQSFLSGIRQLSEENEWFGYTEIKDDSTIIPAIRHFFRKGKDY